MENAEITFSNNDKVVIKEGDILTPIRPYESPDGDTISSMCKPTVIERHIHDGLIPSVMDVVTSCDFFYLDSRDTVYGSKSIVRVEMH